MAKRETKLTQGARSWAPFADGACPGVHHVREGVAHV